MSLNRDFVFYYRLQEGLPGRVEVIPFRDDKSEPGSFMMVITAGVDLSHCQRGGLLLCSRCFRKYEIQNGSLVFGLNFGPRIQRSTHSSGGRHSTCVPTCDKAHKAVETRDHEVFCNDNTVTKAMSTTLIGCLLTAASGRKLHPTIHPVLFVCASAHRPS